MAIGENRLLKRREPFLQAKYSSFLVVKSSGSEGPLFYSLIKTPLPKKWRHNFSNKSIIIYCNVAIFFELEKQNPHSDPISNMATWYSYLFSMRVADSKFVNSGQVLLCLYDLPNIFRIYSLHSIPTFILFLCNLLVGDSLWFNRVSFKYKVENYFVNEERKRQRKKSARIPGVLGKSVTCTKMKIRILDSSKCYLTWNNRL